jgi:hypothetical protein
MGGLQARRARAAVLVDAGRLDEAGREAAAIREDLLAGQWRLDRTGWDLVASDPFEWTGTAVDHPATRAAFSRRRDQEVSNGRPLGAHR